VQAPTTPRPVRQAKAEGEKVARSRWFEWLARSGLLARGVIFVLIGILAIKLASGDAGRKASQEGALRTIAHQPFGEVLLILIAVGFAGYGLWRLLHALLGHGPESTDSGFDRVAALLSALMHAGLCAVAIRVLAGSGEAENPHKTAAGILGWPGGTWLVGGLGAVLVGVGLYQGYRGLSRDFLDDSKTERMGRRTRCWHERLGVFGHLARMVVLCLAGVFLIKAAIEFDPAKAVGLDGVLANLAAASYGPYLLGVVAAGLIAFGLYSIIDALYRRI
jgi:hypothetical protein